MPRFFLICGLLCLASAGAMAAPAPARHHRAPAPLLAAGLPAFVAVGGGASVLRLLRRKKKAVPAA